MINIFAHTRIYALMILGLFGLLADGDSIYSEVHRIKVSGDYIRSDELGNVYLVKDKQLSKYSSRARLLHTFSNLYSGSISHVDVQDPFKVLLFYRDFGQVEFLDHTLSLSSTTVELGSLGLELATLACSSYQGAFWVYDPINFELLRISQALEIIDRSGNLRQVSGYTPDPNYLLERDNMVYMNDPEQGIFIFDRYGTYYKLIPVKDLSSFQVFNNAIIYVKEDRLMHHDTELNELTSTPLPGIEFRSFSVCLSVKPEMAFLLTDEELVFYEIR